MPIIEGMEQRSADWLAMRVGMATASRVCDVMAVRKDKKEAAARADYRKQLVCERLTGLTASNYVSPYMLDGILNEPLAREVYEMQADEEVTEVGFAIHPRIKWFGASPDSLVGKDGLLEIKCLASHNHLDILLAKEIPEEYHPQLLAELACAERQWVDFVSFDARMPKNMRLFVKRFHRDEAKIEAMEKEVEKFLAEVEEMLSTLEQG